MRYGVISDVHANLHALEASLAFLATQDLDGHVCAGDLVGYGPLPNESVRRVLALGGPCIAGNHDLIALGRLSDANCVALARDSLRWTRTVLEDDVRALLAGLPLTASVNGIAIHHGSIGDAEKYVLTEAQARATLAGLSEAAPGASVLVLGHTHRPLAVGARSGTLLRDGIGSVKLPVGEPVLLNPGAVGQSRSRDARARVLVLDTDARVATFHAVDYDIEGCREALRDRALPPDSCHRAMSRVAGLAGATKRGVRRAQAFLNLK
jgi:predicted phosphodiesterase